MKSSGIASLLSSKGDYQHVPSKAMKHKRKQTSLSQINILSKQPMRYRADLTPMHEDPEFLPYKKTPDIPKE